MALVDAIASFATGTYMVTRTTLSTYVNGIAVAGSGSTFNIEASVQPATGRELQTLPEAQHGNEIKVLWTTTELRTRTPTHEPDSISIGSEAYEVFKVELWEHLGTHYKVFVSRTVTP